MSAGAETPRSSRVFIKSGITPERVVRFGRGLAESVAEVKERGLPWGPKRGKKKGDSAERGG